MQEQIGLSRCGQTPTLTECSWRKAQGLRAELASGGAEATQDPPRPAGRRGAGGPGGMGALTG